jgi:hypothetical protein
MVVWEQVLANISGHKTNDELPVSVSRINLALPHSCSALGQP